MTAKEIQKRNEKAQQLRVVYVDDDLFFVESEKGKICYQVIFGDEISCTCGDFVKNRKTDPDFKCKHILAVTNAIQGGDVHEGQVIKKAQPKLDERFITKIEGNEFVKFPGLLDYGHQKGISSIEVEILQFPTKENASSAICKATVVSKVGETFIDIGDADPYNCSSKVRKHLLRMASTRSIARALRSYTNIGMTCLEELEDISDAMNGNSSNESKKKAPVKPAAAKKKPDVPAAEATGKGPEKPDIKEIQTDENQTNAPKMSEAQQRAIMNLSRRRGISVEEVEKMASESYGVTLENLTSSDASAFIRQLQQAA